MYSNSPSPDWREARKERLGSGKSVRSSHSIPESIPEDKEPETPEEKADVMPRLDKERLLETKNSKFQRPGPPSQYKNRLIYVWRFAC